MVIRRCIELFIIVSSIGCVSFQDCEYRFAQNFRAHRAYWSSCDDLFGTRMGRHYARGWKKGYADVLMGGDGQCPAVPPQCYWSFKFQSEAGAAAIDEWYQGYSQGAAEALASGRDQYHGVPRSDYFRQCSPSCLSSDYSEYDYGKSVLGIQAKGANNDATQGVPRGRPASEELIPDSPKPATVEDDTTSLIETESEESGSDGVPPLATSRIEHDMSDLSVAGVKDSDDDADVEATDSRSGTSFVSFSTEEEEANVEESESSSTPRSLEEIEDVVTPPEGFELPPSPVSSREPSQSRSLLVSSRWVKPTSYTGRSMKVSRMRFFRSAE